MSHNLATLDGNERDAQRSSVTQLLDNLRFFFLAKRLLINMANRI
jgi:hypothetical protein